eukprot:m.246697 g.246697  ORF g.246697 m.246697 type:complete len:217 (+) comp19068_c1_seq1:1142-1792(+)
MVRVVAALALLATLSVVAARPETKDVSASSGGVECTLCEFVMKEIDSELSKNSTVAEIEKVVDEVCDLLPSSIRSSCENLVDEYGPKIVQLIVQGLDPAQICTDLGLCSTLDKLVKENGVECVLCEFVMNEVDKELGKNSTEAEIEKVLDDVCEHLPKSLQGGCESLVKAYGPEIVKLILQGLNADQVCKELKLCTTARLLARLAPVPVQAMLRKP